MQEQHGFEAEGYHSNGPTDSDSNPDEFKAPGRNSDLTSISFLRRRALYQPWSSPWQCLTDIDFRWRLTRDKLWMDELLLTCGCLAGQGVSMGRLLKLQHYDRFKETLYSVETFDESAKERVLRQYEEFQAMHDPEQMEIKLSQWRQEDTLIKLLNLGQLDAGPSNARTSSLRHDVARRKATQTRASPPDVFEEPTINGHLQETNVSAFPDTGASANFISLPYAQKHSLAVDKTSRKRVKVGDGSTIRVVGTTTLPFSFAGETTKHDLTFHVLRKSVHDVILGSAFLRASETFTRFAHRVGRKIRESVGRGVVRRLCFLGSRQFVGGTANGVGVDAVPDTGADVSVMSARFAKENGFEVEGDEQHRILLGFADGSTARARGVVKDVAWRFGADEEMHSTDVYVLSSLPVDLVLGYDFLCQTEAFSEHEHDFWHVEDVERGDVWMLCLIRVLKRAMKGAGGEISSNAAEERWQLAKAGELGLYRKAREEAHDLGLSDDEAARYLEPHVARWQQFLLTRPTHSTNAASMSPSTPNSGHSASPSSQAGGIHLQVRPNGLPADGSIEMGRFGMGWFRRKARGKSSVASDDLV